jgi:hypothetical protein
MIHRESRAQIASSARSQPDGWTRRRRKAPEAAVDSLPGQNRGFPGREASVRSERLKNRRDFDTRAEQRRVRSGSLWDTAWWPRTAIPVRVCVCGTEVVIFIDHQHRANNER